MYPGVHQSAVFVNSYNFLYEDLMHFQSSRFICFHSQTPLCLMTDTQKQSDNRLHLQCATDVLEVQPHPVRSAGLMQHICLEMHHLNLPKVCARHHKPTCVQLNLGEEDSLDEN